MSNNEHEGTRGMLRRSVSAAPPAGLEDRIMQAIVVVAEKRARRRMALSALLRYTAIFLLVAAVLQTFLPAGAGQSLARTVKHTVEDPVQHLSWLMENTYFILPLIVLLLVSRFYRMKAG